MITTDPIAISYGMKWVEKAKPKLPELKKENPEKYRIIKNAIRYYEKSNREYQKYAKKGIV